MAQPGLPRYLTALVGAEAQDVAATARVLGKRPGAMRTAAYQALRRLAGNLDQTGVTDSMDLTLKDVR